MCWSLALALFGVATEGKNSTELHMKCVITFYRDTREKSVQVIVYLVSSLEVLIMRICFVDLFIVSLLLIIN